MPVYQGPAPITALVPLGSDYFKLTFACPAVAAEARPGQFANIVVEPQGACLRRPLSFHAVAGDEVTLVVARAGVGTEWLSRRAVGDVLDVLGPLGGRGLTCEPGARRVALVGGGVGLPPLHFVASRRAADGPELVAFLGARSAERLLCLDEFAALGCDVRPSTDDGSAGFHGTAVAALADYLREHQVDQVLSCGPTPMMRAAAELAAAHGLACQVCLEARMACALGACLSCVVETRTDGWQRYQRVCTEGPVFDGADLVWERLSPLCAP